MDRLSETIEYWYCIRFDLYFTDAAFQKPISQEETVLPATGHKYQNGVCTVCGDGTPIEVPNTGDECPVVLWLSLLLISVCGMAVLERRRKNRTR